jgi:hypothetical protein
MALLRSLSFMLLSLVLLAVASGVSARTLYTGEAVLDAEPAPVLTPVEQALEQVLTRLTGLTDVSVVDRLGVSASDVSLLVLSQQRVRRSRLTEEGDTSPEEVLLRVEFDPRGVDALLAKAGLPRLGSTRPSILLWVALEDLQGVRLAADPVLEEIIARQARRLGLDVLRPLGDLQDLSEVEAVDVRGGFLEAAEPSAARYGAGLTVMLDLRRFGPGWNGRWSWRLEGVDAGLRTDAESREGIISRGLESVLGALVDRFGRVAGSGRAGPLQLVVEGIDDEVQYAEVLGYLSALGPVDQVQVIAARDRSIHFELLVSRAGIEDLLTIGDVLEPLATDREGRLKARLKR